MKAAPYFRCFPSDFLSGVAGMTAEEIGVYAVIIMLIYDRGKAVPDDVGRLAWQCRLSRSRATAVVNRLIDIGKIVRTEAGLMNPRAAEELERMAEISRKNAGAAETRWHANGADDGPTATKSTASECERIATAVHPQCLPDTIVQKKGSGSSALSSNDEHLSDVRPKPQKRSRTTYPDQFEVFWKGYPRDANMSKAEALAEWRKLSAEDHALAIKSVPAFVKFCRGDPHYRPIHACRYLKFRRFEGFAEADDVPVHPAFQRVFVEVGTPAWEAWGEYRKRTTGNGRCPVVNDKGRDGWWFEAPMPPSDARAA